MADDYNKKSLEDIAKLLNDITSPLQSVASAISNMIVEADSLNRAFGGGRVRIEEMNYAIKDSVSSINKLGGDISDVTATMAGIAEGSRRNVIATEEQVSKLYASGQILNRTAADLTESFGNAGYEVSQIGVNVEESIGYVQNLGLNAKTITNDVVRNLDSMNRFNFNDGVQGLTKMAAQASMLRFDMRDTANFADKVITPEGAINMSAAFQRLGLAVGSLGDPFKLMNDSINDPGALQDSLINATKAAAIAFSGAGNIGLIAGSFPGGITGIFNPITKAYTISGTATQSGTFTYTIATVGTCATSSTSGTIIVNPINTITTNGNKNETTCVNTAITAILYNTTGATGAVYNYIDQNNIQYNGLPTGLSGTTSITNGTITISGTPTIAGTYSYTVRLIGGCGSGTVAETGVIVVNPANTITLTSPIGSDNQNAVCINTSIQSITYSTTSAIGAYITYVNQTNSGTYTSVTGINFSFNPITKVVSLNGTPTVAGDFDYTITLTGGCGDITKTGKIYVKPNKTITINASGGTNSQTVCINSTINPIEYS
jgi:hypothetical protein